MNQQAETEKTDNPDRFAEVLNRISQQIQSNPEGLNLTSNNLSVSLVN